MTRLGVSNPKAKPHLHELIKLIKENNLSIVFICDAMHGNTQKRDEYKIRELDDLIEEINFTSMILNEYGYHLSGIHLETTPLDVTECFDKKYVTSIKNEKYTSLCDPRLNFDQTVELVTKIKLD